MMDMTFGEVFVVVFIFVAVVSAPYWPKLSERLFVMFAKQKPPSSD